MIQQGSGQQTIGASYVPASSKHQQVSTQPVLHAAHPQRKPQALAQPQTQPQFSGLHTRLMNTSKDRLIKIFGSVSEVFLVAFLAQDVVGMWLPRVGVSLKRGRIEYDPDTDPNAKNLPMAEKVKLWLFRNFKGLNWVNFNEEAGREFATGPGVLMVPTLMYAFARRAYGKSAIELGHAPLKEMTEGFIQHINQSGNSNLNRAIDPNNLTQVNTFKNAFRDELKAYLLKTIGDDDFKKWDFKTSGRTLLDNKAFQSAIEGSNNGEAWLNKWLNKYTELVTKSAEVTGKHKKEVLKEIDREFHKLEAEMKTVVKDVYQKDEVLGKELEKLRSGVRKNIKEFERSSLMSVDEIATKTSKEGAKFEGKTIGTLMEELHRGRDYFGQVFTEKVSAKGASAKLANIAKGVFENIVARKGFFSISITLLAGAYLIKLAQWVQHHDAYPGERLAHGAGGGKAGAHGKNPAPTPAHAQQAQAAPAVGNTANNAGQDQELQQLLSMLGGAQ